MEAISPPPSKQTFSFEAFKQKWGGADSRIKMNMLRFAGELDVEEGLEPVILGLKAYARPVREEAKASLEKLARKAVPAGMPPVDTSRKTGRFTAVIYRELKLTKDLNLTELFFATLLKIGGRGPTLAWNFLSRGFVSENIMMEMTKRLTTRLQLILLHQLVSDRVWVRKQYRRLSRVLFETIQDRETIVSFFAGLFDHASSPDPLFVNRFKCPEILAIIRETLLTSDRLELRIEGIKAAVVFGYPDYRDAMIDLLGPDSPPEACLAILNLLCAPSAPKDSDVIGKVWPLLETGDKIIRGAALDALVSLKVSGLGKTLSGIYQDDPTMRSPIHRVLDTLEWRELNHFLRALPSELAGAARSAAGQSIFKKDPDKLIQFLDYVSLDGSPFGDEARTLRKRIDAIGNLEIDAICSRQAPAAPAPDKPRIGWIEKFTHRKRKNDIQERIDHKFIKGESFQGETISGIDLSDKQLINVDFNGATLSDVIFAAAKLDSVSFKNAYLTNINFDKAVLNDVSFKNAALITVSAQETAMEGCDFTNSRIIGSRFDTSNLQDSLFVNAKVADAHFGYADLRASSFLNADLAAVSFRFACLEFADLSLVKARRCDFEGIDFSALTTRYAELNCQSPGVFDLLESSIPLTKALSQPGGFNPLMLDKEMAKTLKAFLDYNFRRTELAIDTFSPEQGELFELIPLLVHSDLALLPEENPVRNAPAGIYGYHPPPRAFQLLEKYFNVDGPAALHEIAHQIEGLYTIGSIGTIAQSIDSDIDYWICIDDSTLGSEPCIRLEEKLSAIEQWARKIFDIEIHFFPVPISEVREDRFGSSDSESSGSAQGKILKEEFYRTMILVAGRVPLWCAVPPWGTDKFYNHFGKVAATFNKNLVDLGNVSAIPKGEYFGASIWQLLKSLKSPYKSVMKMALLENYLQTGKPNGLLCNRLKKEWTSGTRSHRSMDPYLVLFEEVFRYYHRTDQKQAIALLQICFFLKLGIRRLQNLDRSVIPARKEVILGYLDRWHWDALKLQRLGSYRDWPFEKIFLLSNRINQFMVGTYERLSRSMRAAQDGQIAITPEDLTILGRKMFVQFSTQVSKVEKLPLISHGKRLFEQLSLHYIENGNGSSQWQLVHQRKGDKENENSNELLKQMERIEALIIWLARNDLVESTASFRLMPNPTPITIQDLTDFVKAIDGFFSLEEVDKFPATGLLSKPKIVKLFLVINFCLSRRLNRIHEYAAVYVTTWGEFYCRVFSDKGGLVFVDDAIKRVKTELELPFAGDQIGYFIPRSARKRIRESA